MTKRTVWNWEDVFGRGSPDSRLFLLTDNFRRLLLQATDRFFWASAWTQELTDSEWAVIDDGVRTLMEEEMIEVTVNPNINVQTGTGGSGGVTIPIYVGGAGGDCACLPLAPPGSESPPPISITPGVPPDGWPTYPAYDAARCAIANYGWQLAFEWITALSNVGESALNLTAFLFFMVNFAPALVFAVFSAGALASLLSFLAQVTAYGGLFDDFFNDLKQYLVANRQSIICEAYNQQSEIPLFQAVITPLESYMSGLWAEREYTTTAIYLLERLLQYALPSSVMGLLLNNESEDFFGTYQPPLSCDCGQTPGQDDSWETVFGVVGAHSHEYSQNSEPDHALEVNTAGGGAGASYQQAYNRLVEFVDVSPSEFTFDAITFTVTLMTMGAVSGNAAIRRIAYGGVNNSSDLLYAENTNGNSVSEFLASTTVGLYLEGTAATGAEVDIEVPNKSYLTPQFLMSSVGYGASDTQWSFEIADFAMRPE